MTELLTELHTTRGAGVKVAIVDSGVEGSHAWVGGRLTACYRVEKIDDVYEVVRGEPVDLLGHGTAVAGNIRRFAPDVELTSVQVLGSGLRADSEALLAALRWLVGQDIHLVNLSLSTMREQFALRMGHAIDDLAAREVACICARGYHLSGRAYPTDFSGVVAVSYRELHPARLVFRPKDSVEIDASGVNIEVAWKTMEGSSPGKLATRIVQGSSFACPLVTGLACRFLALRPDLAPYELKSLLKAYALRQAAGWWEPWMESVALPPVSETKA
jgi:subtilisin